MTLTGLAPEDHVNRLDRTSTATWIADDVGMRQGVSVSIEEVSQVAVSDLRWPELSSEMGGTIAASTISHNGFTTQRPEDAVYEVKLLVPDSETSPSQRTLGVVHLPIEPKSYASLWYVHVMTVVIRESGF